MIINPVDSEASRERAEKTKDLDLEELNNTDSVKNDLEIGDIKSQEKQVSHQDEGNTRTLYFFLFIACWGSTMMGMDLGLTGGASLYVIPDLHISSDHWSWISSGATWGSVLGSAL